MKSEPTIAPTNDRVAFSLYTLLAEEARESSERGETIRTAQKETLDNDREALVPGLLDD
jgi:hypothetical protein